MTASPSTPPSTEDLIFEAARDVFYESGFEGARMQGIAKRAGINHSMLHYYFRSKGQLFDAVFKRAALEVMPPVIEVLRSDLPLLPKLELFVDRYMAMILSNPHLPVFVLQELRRNPTVLQDLVGTTTSGVLEKLRKQIRDSVSRGEIRPIEAEHLFANTLSMCVFPVAARPLLQTVFGSGADGFDAFLNQRAGVIKSFLRSALAP